MSNPEAIASNRLLLKGAVLPWAPVVETSLPAGQVWPQLTLAQQEQVRCVLVLVCRDLLDKRPKAVSTQGGDA